MPQIQWIGQTEVLNKLLTGIDPFAISTTTMTIQDAIDFSILLTRTTRTFTSSATASLALKVVSPALVDLLTLYSSREKLVSFNS